MKNSLLLLIIMMVIWCCSACSRRIESASPQQKQAKVEHACCAEQKGATEISDASLYQLGSVWTNQDGHTLPLSALSGKVCVVAMIFTHCQFACPRITSDMQAIEAKLSSSVRKETRFVLFSMDPDRDTPEALQQFAKKMGLNVGQWTLVRGSENDVRELAAALGVKYKKEANGDFSHSNIITVLDRKGEIAHRQEGLGQDMQSTIEAINRLCAAQ